ncbi:hypothetical protein BH18ACT15_BH18ACT15_05140 [soil metagenome]
MTPGLVRTYLVATSIAAGTLAGFSHPSLWRASVLACLGGLLTTVRRRPCAALAGALLLSAAVGWGNVSLRAAAGGAVSKMARAYPVCGFTARIVEDVGWLGVLAAIERADCSGSKPYLGGGLVAFDGRGEAGALAAGRGLLAPLDSDDARDVARLRLGAQAAIHDSSVQTVAGPAGVFAVASAFRSALRRATAAAPDRAGALLRGLTIGDTDDLDPATIERFRRTGLSHIVAVSGSNLAIVVGALVLLCGPLGHRARVAVAAAGITLFVLIVGPEPSVLRAAGMGAIGLLALALGRRAEPVHALGLALAALLVLRPSMVFSAGLHLSALATLGIVLWADPVARRFGRLPRPLALGLALTLTAQAAVAPLLVGVFGQLSLAGPLANVLALPAVPSATILGFAAGAAELVSPGMASILARVAGLPAGWILWVADGLGDRPWAAIVTARWWGAVAALPVAVGLFAAALRRDAPHRSPPTGSEQPERHGKAPAP